MFDQFSRSLTAEAAAHPEFYWLIALALIGLCLWGLFQCFRYLRRARLVEDTATARIRSAAQGYVELIGEAACMGGAPIVAPLTGNRCSWFAYHVEERVQSGRSSHWRTVEKGVSDGLFLLRDDEARCIVDPFGAEVVPAERNTWYGHSLKPDVGPKLGGPWLGIGANYRYHERRIPIGSPLYAVGWFMTDSGAVTPQETEVAVARRLREWKQNYAQVLQRFDADGDGEIDMAEWEVARKAARYEVRQEEKSAAPQWGLDILKQPPDRRPYLLAARSQGALARYFRLQAGLGLAEFLLGGVLAALMLQAVLR